jgi:H+/Na+-translocating ferredoxin:NAD+ oxidoreductase subunit G
MSLSTKMIVVLTLISILSGGILSIWDNITKPAIEAYKLQELQKAIAEVLPQFDAYKEVKEGDMTLYVGVLEDIPEPLGVAFEAVGNGFQGKISIMVGINNEFTEIYGIKILEQIETPGLGTKIVEDPTNKKDPFWWPNQFKGLQTNPEIGVVKNIKPTKSTDIQAITGATISSQAVVNILNAQINQAKKIYFTKFNKPNSQKIN